jgi:uncharacterized protein YndB with AHSA1/START domain
VPDADDPGTFTHELHIDARPEVVYSYFTDPTRMAGWMGIDHKLDPVPGGVYRVDINGRDIAVGQFVELDPPSHLVFTWGWEGSADLPPGATTIEVELLPDDTGTRLRFTHRGLPVSRAASHAEGWQHYLGRLQVAARGGDAGPDPWVQPDDWLGSHPDRTGTR